MSRGGSESPPMSPDPCTRDTPSRDRDITDTRDSRSEKFSSVSPTKLPEHKPFRGFDITSLIRKDDEKDG